MATNIFFQDSKNVSQEQSLVEDLIVESIQIHGIDCYYIPRESATGNIDLLYGEDTLSKFADAYPIEMYVDRVEGFDGQGELLAKFGLQLNNQADLVVSIKRFSEATQKKFVRPREGDLVYIGLKPNLFEIKYVEDKTDFYQLGKLYFYKLRVEAFRIGNENIETGIDNIDDVARDVGYKLNFTLNASGSGNYTVGEQIYQGASYATAVAVGEVALWDNPSKVLSVINIAGEFVANTNINGVVSGAVYQLASYDDIKDENSPMQVNRTIQDEANTTLNFSESNPFSESAP